MNSLLKASGYCLAIFPFSVLKAEETSNQRLCVCSHVLLALRRSVLPDPSEDAVQIFLHLHQGAGVEQETLVHLLQPHV